MSVQLSISWMALAEYGHRKSYRGTPGFVPRDADAYRLARAAKVVAVPEDSPEVTSNQTCCRMRLRVMEAGGRICCWHQADFVATAAILSGAGGTTGSVQ